MKDVILSTAKNLACDGQMLHSFDFAQDRFVQHDKPESLQAYGQKS